MKDYYKISEISQLYGIGVDSLRYYEKLGILKPRRDTNRYRLYSLKDLYKLNMIRDLRTLDFSMQQIKDYLEGQSVENTLQMLYCEREMLKGRLEELRLKEERLVERISTLQTAQQIEVGVIVRKTIPRRFCVRINERITRDEEMDFAIKKLHKKYEGKIKELGNLDIGAFLSMEEINQGISNVYNSVFFILGEETVEHDFELPEGEYLSCFYRGSYEQNGPLIRQLLEYANKQEMRVLGTPFEIYVIDNRDTAREEEFLTEIQVRIEDGSHHLSTNE